MYRAAVGEIVITQYSLRVARRKRGDGNSCYGRRRLLAMELCA